MMRAKIIVIIAFIFSFTLLSGQTVIPGGDVLGNWTASGSPYLIGGDIQVPVGQSLLIDSGVTIEFQGYHKFDIYGLINALGTETDSVIIYGSGPVGYHGLKIYTEEAVSDSILFEYCRFENGNPSGSWPLNCGGGIGIWYFDKVRVEHCLFKKNKAVMGETASGGAICTAGFDGVIRNCTFIRNETYSGGGAIELWKGSNGIIADNYFEHNTSDLDGGAIEILSECNPHIIRNEFVKNYCINNGGAIHVYDTCSPIIEHNSFTDNTAGTMGGAIALWVYSNAIVKWNEFSLDTAFAHGGAMVVGNNSSPVIERNLFTNNYAIWDGGAIDIVVESNPYIANNTFSFNEAGNHGGGIDVYENSCPVIINNIIWDNSATSSSSVYLWDSTCYASFFNNDIQYGKDSIGLFDPTINYKDNIDEDPLFEGGFPFDFHLTGMSPCIDAGYDTIMDPDGTVSDMGVYYLCQTGIAINDADKLKSELDMQVFPNPFQTNLNIILSLKENAFGDCRLSVYDARGVPVKIIADKHMDVGSNTYRIQTSDLPDGVYYIQLQTATEQVTRKVVKR